MIVASFVLVNLDSGWQEDRKQPADGQKSWFNGSRRINTTEGWAYVNLTFPAELAGKEWTVRVYGAAEDGRMYIYTMDSSVNSSVNGVKLNLKHSKVSRFECFDIEIEVEHEMQVERVCLAEFEIID